MSRAQRAAVAEPLAQLGRSLMREADQHAWCAELWERCGWTEESREGMIRFAIEAPALAEKHWLRLMETDGFRGAFVESEGYVEFSDEQFDDAYTAFALAFDRYFPAMRVAAEEADPLVEIPGAPGIFAPRSRVEAAKKGSR